MRRSVEHICPAVPRPLGTAGLHPGKEMFEFRIFDAPPHTCRASDSIFAYSPYIRPGRLMLLEFEPRTCGLLTRQLGEHRRGERARL